MINPVIKIGTFSLHDTTSQRYVTSLAVESSTPQKLDIFTVVKSDRHKVTAGWMDLKSIELSGMVEADDATQLISKLDALKAALMGVGLTLFVSDGTNHRLWYVNTDGSVEVTRNKMYCLATYTVRFVVADPPYGIEANSDGTPKTNTQSVSLAAVQNIFSLTFDGSARPTPKLQFTLASTATPDLTSIFLLNRENGQSLTISFAGITLANGDVLVIDSARREVLFRGRPISYEGTIPDFERGTNEMEVFFATSNSNIQVAAQKVVNDYEIVRDTVRVAQQFTPASGQNMAFVTMALQKILSPTGNVRVGVMADSSGSPSGTYLGSTINIDMATIKSNLRWFTVALAGVGITAGSAYWLVLDAPSSTSSQTQHIRWAKARQDQGYGNIKVWDGSTWVLGAGDMAFRAYTSNSTAQNQTIDTQTIFEDFVDTARRDTGNTTAKWIGDGAIYMNGVLTSPTDVSTATGHNWPTGACRFCDAVFFKFTVPGPVGSTVLLKDFSLNLKHTGTPDTFTVLLRNTYNGSDIFSISTGTVSNSGSYNTYTVPINQSLTAGNTYWIGGYSPTWSIDVQGAQGTGGSSFDANNTKVVLLTDWARTTPSFTGTWAYSGVAAVNHNLSFEYQSYAVTEYGTSTQLNTGNAEILSVSQFTHTILLQLSTYQGQISANAGAAYTNIPRDAFAFQTETVPAFISNGLKYRAALQNTSRNVSPYVLDTAIYWREGLAIDSTTKRASQSFSPSATGLANTAKLYLMKYGSPGNLTVEIQSDSSGSPSGTLVHANATATVLASDISSTAFGFINVAFAGSFTLNAGTTYHIVIKAASTANDANKVLIHANFNRYAAGQMLRSTNSGGSYSGFTNGTSGYDLIFAILGSGGFNFTSNLEVTHQNLWL